MLLEILVLVLGTLVVFLALRSNLGGNGNGHSYVQPPAPMATSTTITTSAPAPLPFQAVKQNLHDITLDDLVVAMVGHVSAGKSSLFKRLLGMSASDNSVPVAERGGSSDGVLWDLLPRPRNRQPAHHNEPRRVLADLPGTGQAQAEGVSLEAVHRALDDGARRVNMVLLVIGKSVDESDQYIMRKARDLPLIRSAPERRIFVLMTKCDTLSVKARQERREEIIKKLKVTADQVIECSAGAYSPTLEPDELSLRQEADRRFDHDAILTRLADELDAQQQAMLEENHQGIDLINGGDVLAMSATGVVAAAAVWLPGISAWGVLAGPALLTPIGWIAVGPVAVVAGSVGTVYGARKLWARFGRENGTWEGPH